MMIADTVAKRIGAGSGSRWAFSHTEIGEMTQVRTRRVAFRNGIQEGHSHTGTIRALGPAEGYGDYHFLL